MIKYVAGTMGICFVLQLRGSVFPKALAWALPNALLAVLMHSYGRGQDSLNMQGVNMLWSGYTSVLGFLVVFRNNQAYTRFWEGATLINQVRGEWFNAVSTLFAFCNSSKDLTLQVETFQHTLVRLASMLYCSALQQVCDLEDDTLEIIDNEGMDADSLGFMQQCNDRCEILLQWIQRLIVESEESKTIKIAPPLLTRAFQELSRGIVNLNNARKIKDIPFPFPYAQMITCMMLVHWIVTPLFASQVIESVAAAACVCFFVTFSFWCLLYITLEIDQPFGDDSNDLPLREMQRDFNQSLLNLMHQHAQRVPAYEVNEHRWRANVSNSKACLPPLAQSKSQAFPGSESSSHSSRVVEHGELAERIGTKQAPGLRDARPAGEGSGWLDVLRGPSKPQDPIQEVLSVVDIALDIEPRANAVAPSTSTSPPQREPSEPHAEPALPFAAGSERSLLDPGATDALREQPQGQEPPQDQERPQGQERQPPTAADARFPFLPGGTGAGPLPAHSETPERETSVAGDATPSTRQGHATPSTRQCPPEGFSTPQGRGTGGGLDEEKRSIASSGRRSRHSSTSGRPRSSCRARAEKASHADACCGLQVVWRQPA